MVGGTAEIAGFDLTDCMSVGAKLWFIPSPTWYSPIAAATWRARNSLVWLATH